MRSIAIITARGGSKRIPRKNIRDFNGKPILAYSVEAALESALFDTVMVSTDDEEIEEVAKRYGASVPFLRSEQTSDDFATTADVLLEVLHCYEKEGQRFDLACCLYPTAPFVTAAKLREGMRLLTESDADTVLPVVRFSYPVQRSLVLSGGKLVFSEPKYLNARSQDLHPHFHDAGQFVCFRVEAFQKNRHLLLGNILPLEVPETEVQDIDTETDWEIAELKYRMMTRHGHPLP